jgi:hypothetical protein
MYISNSMDIDYEKLKRNIEEATNDKELDKLLKKYQDNLGLSAGDPEIDFLFEARRKFIEPRLKHHHHHHHRHHHHHKLNFPKTLRMLLMINLSYTFKVHL